MKLSPPIFLPFLLFLAFTLGCQGTKKIEQQVDPFAAFDWLPGRWQRTDMVRPGQQGFEIWEKAADQSLRGTGFVLQGRDTLFREELKIIRQDDGFYFMALPEPLPKGKWVAFKITAFDQQHFESENADHDYPKAIAYFLESAGELRAKISGREREQHFVFRKEE